MEDWKYLRKLQLTEKHGVLKGIAIALFILLLVGTAVCAFKCLTKKECNCEDITEDDFENNDE